MARASGSAIFSVAAFTRGSKRGITGTTEAGSSTTLHMLSTIWQQVRLTSSDLSLSPRESTGNMAASAGVSTFCTKTHPASFSTHLCVWSRDWAASITEGRKGSKSLLPVQAQIAPMHSTAAALTSFLRSQVKSATGDTRVTSVKPMDLGDDAAIAEIRLSVASFCGGFAFTPRPAKREGMINSTAKGLIFPMMAFAAATAASFTFLDLSPTASAIFSKPAIRKGSAALPFSSANLARPSKEA
mmetsp:Transcript_83835/g.179679  ORF Transcript_83835/g.179679 Transcript_83835/m.179679 type:complete len:243 (-) Transcript_83835:141-869(-)